MDKLKFLTLGSQLRLRPSIVILFVLLVVPVFAAMLWFTYTSNDKMTRMSANDLMTRYRSEAVANTKDLLLPIRTLVASAANIGQSHPDYYRDDKSWNYLGTLLGHSETVGSVYVGLEDGSFRMLMRLPPKARIQDRDVDPEAKFAYRSIDQSSKTSPLDNFTFKAEDLRQVGSSSAPATYDPRERTWYKDASSTRKVSMSDPYIFSATGVPGITLAAPIYQGGKLLGVVGADITLSSLSHFLADRVVSPHAISLIVDDNGKVIANSNLKEQPKLSNGKVELKNLATLDSDLANLALTFKGKNSGQDNFTFEHPTSKVEYAAISSQLPKELGKNWQVLIVAPLNDFAGPLQDNNRHLLLLGNLAIVLQIGLIYFLSRLIARPLERLENKVMRVRNLDMAYQKDDTPISAIREISSLSRAVDTLDHAIKSFAAFVPVGLVKQLIDSDKELELGGHSRFLTMLFCDVEAFSTLAENSPSQELLMRVSQYLEVVTECVNEEHGTIDKFIGDAAMAFWGAPALLEDHAWHACAAAIKISQRMASLNAKWMAQGLDPLLIRVGIHCDSVLVGNIGSRQRMSYTVMGDGVNIAARLEGINKEYDTRICVSHAIYREAGERLQLRPIDEVVVKGRKSKLNIYELHGVIGADVQLQASPQVQDLCLMTKQAHTAYAKHDWSVAMDKYLAIRTRYEGDRLALNMIHRCEAALNAESSIASQAVEALV